MKSAISRKSGILLHVTSLPGSLGVGDMGESAKRFINFLNNHHQKIWQILPLTPTDKGNFFSPYSSYSAFAGNPLIISIEKLILDLKSKHHNLNLSVPFETKDKGGFTEILSYKIKILREIFNLLSQHKNSELLGEIRHFEQENLWLNDFALFKVIKDKNNGSAWYDWDAPLKKRDEATLNKIQQEEKTNIDFIKWVQAVFYGQWGELKQYANNQGISIMGDVPIYVSKDSVEVWASPELFLLDENLNPTFVAGVPPDAFSEDGQMWGNPLYNWSFHQETHFKWWMERICHNLKLSDYIRIDHFRGLVGFWQIPSENENAKEGTWENATPYPFFNELYKHIHNDQVIAEDLGIITDDVKEVIAHYDIATMKVLQFGYFEDNSMNPYRPHALMSPNCLIYTGTHDNNTTLGWWDQELDDNAKRRLKEYLNKEPTRKDICKDLIRLALMSTAKFAIFPIQDILELDAKSRMNLPAAANLENWRFKMEAKDLDKEFPDLRKWTDFFGR